MVVSDGKKVRRPRLRPAAGEHASEPGCCGLQFKKGDKVISFETSFLGSSKDGAQTCTASSPECCSRFACLQAPGRSTWSVRAVQPSIVQSSKTPALSP